MSGTASVRAATPALGMAVVGTESLERFLAFYGDVLGMEASPVAQLSGAAFERFWSLPQGGSARAVLMSVGGSDVGQVLGLEFDSGDRRWICDGAPGPFIGYWNLNFYVDGIVERCAVLAQRGMTFWSRPISHVVAPGAGAPIEAIFLGPDHVAINLVELAGASGSTVEDMRQESAGLPRSRTGYSQVATSAHATRDIDAAIVFHREVLGMRTMIDTILESPQVNALTGRPPQARTRVVWMRGDHPYGKVALSQALNYTLADRASQAAAPAIGYLAQGFAVPDLARALRIAADFGAVPRQEPEFLELAPGLRVMAAMLHAPGSGALLLLMQAVGGRSGRS